MATVEPMTHVRLDERGPAWIADTNVKVIDGAIAEELQRWEVQTRDCAESPIRRKLRAMGKLA